VIRIHYSSELQPGLHARAERHGDTTRIYLLPWLTHEQRRAALRRLRQQGRMGISPRLPCGQLAIALLVDRVRTAFGQAGAIVRVHPAGSALPVVVATVAIAAFLVLCALSVHIVHLPPQSGGGVAAGNAASGRTPGWPLPSPSAQPTWSSVGQRSPAEGQPVSARSSLAGAVGGGTGTGPGGVPGSASSGSSTANPGGGPSSGAGAGPTPSGGSNTGSASSSSPGPTTQPTTQPTTGSATPGPSPVPSATPTSGASPLPSPSTSPSSTAHGGGGTGGQLCVGIGSVGICVGL
jgi:hypothetical protein